MQETTVTHPVSKITKSACAGSLSDSGIFASPQADNLSSLSRLLADEL